MSLALAVLIESNWLQEDGAKLFFFGSCFVALLILLNHLSRRFESKSGGAPQPTLAPEPVELQPEDVDEPQEQEQAEPEDSEDSEWLPPARTVDFSLREIRFKSFEMDQGPPDPDSFCDKVSVEIIYQRRIMPWEFTVATPKGLESKFRGKGWDARFLQQAMIVPRYDSERITASIMNFIKVSLESIPEEVAEDEMKEADPAT